MTTSGTQSQPGDVFEMASGGRLAYFQHTHTNELDGAVVRVLPGMFQSRPVDLDRLVSGSTRFIDAVFVPYETYPRDTGTVTRVGSYAIPEDARRYPLLKDLGVIGPAVKELRWNIWDRGRIVLRDVINLTDEQWEMPMFQLAPVGALIERVFSDWSWRRETELQYEALKQSASVGAPEVTSITHFLYFKSRSDAEAAAANLLQAGQKVQVEEYDDSWLVRVTTTEDTEPEETPSKLEKVVKLHGGEYDGWEAALSYDE